MGDYNFVDQAHDRAVQRTVDTLSSNSASLLPAIVVKPHHDRLLFALFCYTILYTLATVLTVIALTSKINDTYDTPAECVRRQEARTALRLGILKNPDLSADDRIYIEKALPPVLVGSCRR